MAEGKAIDVSEEVAKVISKPKMIESLDKSVEATKKEEVAKKEEKDDEKKAETKEQTSTKVVKPAGPSMVQKFVIDNVFLQHLLLTPLIIVAVYYIPFGSFIIWPIFIAACIFIAISTARSDKKALYDLNKQSQEEDNITDVQEVAWLNQVVGKYWVTCVPALVKPQIDQVTTQLTELKPPFLYKLEIGDWALGKKGPRFTQLRTTKEPDTTKYVMDGEIVFTPDFFIDLRTEPVPGVAIKVSVANVVFKGRIRIRFNLNEEVPNASIVSVCFVGDPTIGFAIKPMGAVDLLPLQKMYDWIYGMIIGAIKPMMVWPQKLQFTLGQGEVISEHDIEEPITNIAIIDTKELAEPAGYLILEKVLNGVIPGDLNVGASSKNTRELYLTYRRDVAGASPPITGIAVVCPENGDVTPEGFTMIEKTPNGLDANMNAGTKGPATYLCYSTAPGIPITGLAIMNLHQKQVFSTIYTRVALTPSNKIANINEDTKDAHPLFIAYRGGCRSPYGYPRDTVANPECGVLHINMIEGDNLVAADLGGSSDPYVVLKCGPAGAKKLKKQKGCVVPSSLFPVWDDNFVFENVNKSDILTINVYDKDAIGSDDSLGQLELPLTALVQGKKIEMSPGLQLAPKGCIHFTIEAVDFGLSHDNEPTLIEPLTSVASSGLFSKVNPMKNVGILGFGATNNTSANDGMRRPMKEVNKEAREREPGSEFLELTSHVEKLPTSSTIPGISQGWQRRWLVLSEHKLSWCRSSKDSVENALGTVGLKNASIELTDDSFYSFDVVTSAKTVKCKVNNERELLMWCHALKTNIKVAGEAKSRFETSEKDE